VPVDNPVEQIKERVSIVDLVGQRVKLAKSGRNLKGLCPFHTEKTPSFYVFPDQDRYHCFGCGQSGDVFTWVMRTDNVEFGEALRLLAERVGIELKPPQARKAEDDRFDRLRQVNEATTRYFHSMLFAPSGKAALAYLGERGLTRATIDAFQLGWAPDSWDALLTRLQQDGFAVEELVELGLVLARDSGGHYDRFRGRITFPIRDAGGAVIGFGGRAMGDAQPKYLNSSDSPLFSKGSSLYAIDVARAAIKKEGVAVVVEGYMDALAAHQAGIQHVVAALGTALTEEHLASLKRLAPRIVLALDADAAGDTAALRTLEVVRGTYGRIATPVADRRGLVRLRYDQVLDVRVARLPSGQDPDDVIKASPQRFLDLVAEAKPILEVLIDAEVQKGGSDAQARSLAADNVLDVLKDLPNAVLADQYVRLLGERLAVDYDALRGRLADLRRTARRRGELRPAGPPRPAEPRATAEAELRDWLTLEEFILRLVLQHPEAGAAALVELAPDDVYRADARAVLEQLQAGGIDELDGPLEEYARWIAGWGEDLPPLADDQVVEELGLLVHRLRMLNHRREIALIALHRRDRDREGDPEGWPQERARIAELTAEIRRLERETPGRRQRGFVPYWAGLFQDEAKLGMMRTMPRPRQAPPPPDEAVAAAG
jgi:DNA primase